MNQKIIEQAASAHALASAILDDYAQHISKIEGITAQQVKDRINAASKAKYEKSKKPH